MEVNVNFIPGFINKCNSLSIYKINIEPQTRYVSIPECKEIPIPIIKEEASRVIATYIVNNLTYKYVEQFDRLEGGYHQFSIKDYTIKESEVSKQIITGLTNDLENLNSRYDNLREKHHILQTTYKYNSRPISRKLIDWLLYDKPFNKL